MSSSDKTFIGTLIAISFWGTSAGMADIGCPPTHDGKSLEHVELFVGPPTNRDEVRPEDGRFVVPQAPQALWDRYPPSTLGCTYRGSKDMVVVELPRSVRVCEFPHYPQVECH